MYKSQENWSAGPLEWTHGNCKQLHNDGVKIQPSSNLSPSQLSSLLGKMSGEAEWGPAMPGWLTHSYTHRTARLGQRGQSSQTQSPGPEPMRSRSYSPPTLWFPGANFISIPGNAQLSWGRHTCLSSWGPPYMCSHVHVCSHLLQLHVHILSVHRPTHSHPGMHPVSVSQRPVEAHTYPPAHTPVSLLPLAHSGYLSSIVPSPTPSIIHVFRGGWTCLQSHSL